MMFRCLDLLDYEFFNSAQLISGENGLYREISWIYIKTTDTLSQWVNGKELLFVLIDNNNIDLYIILKEAINKNLSGIVILLKNEDFIISDEIIKLSNKANLPIFKLPWDVKLINLTQNIIEKIQEYKEKDKEAKKIFREILELETDSIKKIEEFYEIDIKNYNFITIVESENIEELNLYYNNYFYAVKNNFLLRGLINSKNMLYFQVSNRIIFLLFIQDIATGENLRIKIEKEFIRFKNKYKSLYLVFSKIEDNNKGVKNNFENAEKCILIVKKEKLENNVLYYENLGVYRMFIEIEKNYNIQEYCLKNISKLLNYDSKHNTNLLETLEFYFKNNRHLIHTAEKLYVHRNTLIYRLNLIKDLLDTDLNDAMKNLELFNSIIFYNFSKIKDVKEK